MAMNIAERSAKAAKKRRDGDEEELRVWTKPATRTVLKELMEWHGITEQAEAVTLLLHHVHDLGREGSARFLTPPRHTIAIPPRICAILASPPRQREIDNDNERPRRYLAKALSLSIGVES